MPAVNGNPCPDRWNMFDWSELDLMEQGLQFLGKWSSDPDIESLLQEIKANKDLTLPPRKKKGGKVEISNHSVHQRSTRP